MTGSGEPADSSTGSTADAAADEDEPVVSVWRRWPDAEAVPFHEYCSLRLESMPPVFGYGDPYPEGEPPPLSYVPPLARWALRHTPLLVSLGLLITAVIQFGHAFLAHVFELIQPVLSPMMAGALLLFVIWVWVLGLLVSHIFESRESSAIPTIVVHTLSIGLTVGLLLSMYTAIPAVPVPLPPGIASAIHSMNFPFFWMLFVGGYLVYDGMLRTENMFDKLETKRPEIIHPESDYGAFQRRLKEDLDESVQIRAAVTDLVGDRRIRRWVPEKVKAAYLFSAIFVAPFFLVGLVFQFSPDSASSVAVRGMLNLVIAVLNFFLVVVFFQFLVLIAYFNRLLSDATGDGYGSVRLLYNPTHHDDYAGFGDFGKFATRVNVLLGVGGIYIVNYLYGGLRGYPGYPGHLTLEFLAWGLATLFPLLTYMFAVVVWFYLSFWQMHKKMKRGRERMLEELARQDDEPDMTLRNGPVWPVDGHRLISNISIDLIPLLSFLPFVRF